MTSDVSIVLFTLGTAALATLWILPLGLMAAWGLSRWSGPGKAVVETLFALPMVLPPTAVGLLLLLALRRGGTLGQGLAQLHWEVLFTWRAVVLAGGIMAFPLLVRTLRTAFEGVDPRLLQMARSLGSSPVQALFRVALPLAWRGILAGTLLAFSRALGEFGATILIAGNIPGRTQTLALAIFQRVELGHDDEALRLVLWTVLLAFLAVGATEWLLRRETRRRDA